MKKIQKYYMSATKTDEKLKVTFTDKRKYYKACRKLVNQGYHVFCITMRT